MQAKDSDRRYLAGLVIGALGVVFGDIGTSPLYALRECFHGEHAVAVTRANILGVLSLIFWSLLIIVSIKYLTFVMRADNKGEGGILALLSLALGERAATRRRAHWLTAIGLFGAALLYGDGMITPAISVLSAVEGLQIASPVFQTVHYSDHGRHSSGSLLGSALRHGTCWNYVWAGHLRVVRYDCRAGN